MHCRQRRRSALRQGQQSGQHLRAGRRRPPGWGPRRPDHRHHARRPCRALSQEAVTPPVGNTWLRSQRTRHRRRPPEPAVLCRRRQISPSTTCRSSRGRRTERPAAQRHLQEGRHHQGHERRGPSTAAWAWTTSSSSSPPTARSRSIRGVDPAIDFELVGVFRMRPGHVEVVDDQLRRRTLRPPADRPDPDDRPMHQVGPRGRRGQRQEASSSRFLHAIASAPPPARLGTVPQPHTRAALSATCRRAAASTTR